MSSLHIFARREIRSRRDGFQIFEGKEKREEGRLGEGEGELPQRLFKSA